MSLEDVKMHLMTEYNEVAELVRGIEEHAEKFHIPKENLYRDVSYISLITRKETISDLLKKIMKIS